MTTGNYSMTASREPVTSSPPSATMIDDSHDKNDVEVTSPVDDNKTKKTTRKKQKSSVKPEETGEQVATVEQVDKEFGENFDILITTRSYDTTKYRENVTLSPPSATVNGDNYDKNDAEVTSPVDDDKTKKKTRKKRKSSRKSEEIEDVTTEPVDKEFGRDLDILMTALNSNATSSLERVALASPSAAVEVDNGAKNDEDVKTPVADNTTKKNTRKKRKSSRKSEELDEKATAEPTSNDLETDEVFQVEEVIVKQQFVPLTGSYGSPSYAAALGLTADENAPSADAVRRQKRRSGSATGTGSRTSNRKSSSSSSDKMASKRQRLMAVLEDAFPTALSTDELSRIARVSREDTETLLTELCQFGTATELEGGLWMRAQLQRDALPRQRDKHSSSSSRSKRASASETDAKQHEFCMVTQMPTLPRYAQPTIAIVTLLYCEKLAVDALIDYKTTYIRRKKGGEGHVFTVGKIGKHRVVSTKLPRIGQESATNTATRSIVTRLLGTFALIEHVFLVGVAGGVACFDDDTRHVRRGDVIVSQPAQPGGVIYMQIASRDDDDSQSCLSWSARDPTLSDIAGKLLRKPKTFYKQLDKHITDGLSELDDDEQKRGGSTAARPTSFRRPPSDSDRLYTRPGETETRIDHPPVTPDSRREQRPGQPVVHLGVMATGHVVDHQRRTNYLDEQNVRAFDAGFQAVLESMDGNRKESILLVRGVCDYGDGSWADQGRRDEADWRPYSALAAASVMKCIVLDIVATSNGDNDDSD